MHPLPDFPVCYTANFTHMGLCRAHPFSYFIILRKKEVRCERMDTTLAIILMIVAAVVGIGAGFVIGMTYRKKVAEREIGSAETEATRIINEAIRSAESKKKEMMLDLMFYIRIM